MMSGSRIPFETHLERLEEPAKTIMIDLRSFVKSLGGNVIEEVRPHRVAYAKTMNFRQAGEFYRSLSAKEQANLISNLSGDLGVVKNEALKYSMVSYFHKADSNYGRALAKAMNLDAIRVEKLASNLRD